MLTKMLFKTRTQYFPFQIKWNRISKHFIKIFQSFKTKPNKQSDLGERIRSLLFYPDLPDHIREKKKTKSNKEPQLNNTQM
jgi:hypothetical protein